MISPRPVGTSVLSTWDTDLVVQDKDKCAKGNRQAAVSKRLAGPDQYLVVRVAVGKRRPAVSTAGPGAITEIRSQALCLERRDTDKARVVYVLGTYSGSVAVTVEVFRAGARVAIGADTVTAAVNGNYSIDLVTTVPLAVGDAVTVRITASLAP